MAGNGRHDVDFRAAAHMQTCQIATAHVDAVVGKEGSWADHGQRPISFRRRLEPGHRFIVGVGNERPLVQRLHSDEALWEDEQLIGVQFERAEAMSVNPHGWVPSVRSLARVESSVTAFIGVAGQV